MKEMKHQQAERDRNSRYDNVDSDAGEASILDDKTEQTKLWQTGKIHGWCMIILLFLCKAKIPLSHIIPVYFMTISLSIFLLGHIRE